MGLTLELPVPAVAARRRSRWKSRVRLEVFDDLYNSSVTDFPKEPGIVLYDLHSITLYALGGNTEAIHVAFTKASARARKFLTLNAGGTVSIAVTDARESFDLTVWVRNSTTTTTQGLYVFGLRRVR